eukprot:CAMPEP_0170620028 /NCGR_PEP_ID=MMETSP0224-20130122/27839_1 /TAXON_ID=285029 /ORGANISM="Togula jolla, Strain CCCM 725" /LENGTH=93 /DNA_ID=CAMNT_0010946173 /DNA_START=76 /DNA_END=357 /DNA_ORIENTATION=+
MAIPCSSAIPAGTATGQRPAGTSSRQSLNSPRQPNHKVFREQTLDVPPYLPVGFPHDAEIQLDCFHRIFQVRLVWHVQKPGNDHDGADGNRFL